MKKFLIISAGIISGILSGCVGGGGGGSSSGGGGGGNVTPTNCTSAQGCHYYKNAGWNGVKNGTLYFNQHGVLTFVDNNNNLVSVNNIDTDNPSYTSKPLSSVTPPNSITKGNYAFGNSLYYSESNSQQQTNLMFGTPTNNNSPYSIFIQTNGQWQSLSSPSWVYSKEIAEIPILIELQNGYPARFAYYDGNNHMINPQGVSTQLTFHDMSGKDITPSIIKYSDIQEISYDTESDASFTHFFTDKYDCELDGWCVDFSDLEKFLPAGVKPRVDLDFLVIGTDGYLYAPSGTDSNNKVNAYSQLTCLGDGFVHFTSHAPNIMNDIIAFTKTDGSILTLDFSNKPFSWCK